MQQERRCRSCHKPGRGNLQHPKMVEMQNCTSSDFLTHQVCADQWCTFRQSSKILILLSSRSSRLLLQSSGFSDIRASALEHSFPAKMWYPQPVSATHSDASFYKAHDESPHWLMLILRFRRSCGIGSPSCLSNLGHRSLVLTIHHTLFPAR